MDKLTQDFANSLIVSAENGLKDCIELGIDSFIKDGILKEFPIVSTIVSGLKIAKNIYDRNLLKQTITFIDELNNGNLSKDKLIAHQSTIQNNPQKCEEELGRVLIYLNSFVDKEKSVMLAKLYKSYILQIINWDEFCEYTEIVNRLFIQDIPFITGLHLNTYVAVPADYYKNERISFLGIIKILSFPVMDNKKIENKSTNYNGNSYIKLSNYGKKFVDIIK